MTGSRAHERKAGVLLHPTSLPGPYGVGDVGPEADRFLDFLAEAGQALWQVLPLGPPGYGDSPYAARSSFAGNELLISPDLLVADGFLERHEVASPPHFPTTVADFEAAGTWQEALFRVAFRRFQAAGRWHELRDFERETTGWLPDYALFRALHQRDRRGWWEWPAGLARREPVALERAKERDRNEVAYHVFVQWLFDRQWQRLRTRARALEIEIMGDVPIFPAYDSADVWANQRLFKLDARGRQTVVAGVPPDYFSKTGQRWGNPVHRWDVQAADGFGWWIERFRWLFRLVDIARIDHFRGFAAAWEIPASEPTAVKGHWVPGPGRAFFERVATALPGARFVAEDLGMITDDVRDLLAAADLPGMRVLQFAFDSDARSPHLPHNLAPGSVVYTGTHDNDTTAGWLATASDDIRRRFREYAGLEREPGVDDLVRLAYASVAATAIVPMQDVLSLGGEARMNTPAQGHGNWRWRFAWPEMPEARPESLRAMAAVYGR
jgi:4-alpha-glucanotransferase